VTDGWHPVEGGSGPYQGPPPTAPHDPGSAPAPYPYPNPYAAPQPYPNPYAYPTGYGYPAVPSGQRRPGTLTAAAALGYVNAGLLVIAGLLLFTGASLVNDVDQSTDGVDLGNFTTELTFGGFLNLFAGGLLISGGVLMAARRPNGRALYAAGAAVVVIESGYWLIRWASRADDAGGIVMYALIFGALAVVGLTLAWTRDSSGWLNGRPGQPAPPYT
jgi:hypothetical protein